MKRKLYNFISTFNPELNYGYWHSFYDNLLGFLIR